MVIVNPVNRNNLGKLPQKDDLKEVSPSLTHSTLARTIQTREVKPLITKTPGDTLSSKRLSEVSVSIMGLNTSTTYFVGRPGNSVSNRDLGLPEALQPSSLSNSELTDVVKALHATAGQVIKMNNTLHSALNLTIAAEPIHKANKQLGALQIEGFEQDTLKLLRPEEEKSYERYISLNPKVDYLPFENVFTFLGGLSDTANDLKTLWLYLGVNFSMMAKVTISRNKNNEIVATFSKKYGFEPGIELASDIYWDDKNDKKTTEGTAFGFIFSSLSFGFQVSVEHSTVLVINRSDERQFVEDLLDGSLNIAKAVQYAKSVAYQSSADKNHSETTPLDSDSHDCMTKHFESTTYLNINVNAGIEIGCGAGIGSDHLAVKDEMQAEGWAWPCIEVNGNCQVFMQKFRTTHEGRSSHWEGPTFLEITRILNFSMVLATDFFKKGEYGKDFWLLLFPFECDAIQTYVIALRKQTKHNNTAFYNIQLDSSSKSLEIIKKSLMRAGVSNKDVERTIISIVKGDRDSYKIELEYMTNNNRDFSRITSAEYQLSHIQIFQKKSATVTPVGLRSDTNFKTPLLNKTDKGTVSFHSMIARIDILESTVTMVISGMEQTLDKKAVQPSSTLNSLSGIRKRASTGSISSEGSQFLSARYYV
ncbi:MAG: hypothetical protein ACPGEF_01840 [Endozoicomonas sp.]